MASAGRPFGRGCGDLRDRPGSSPAATLSGLTANTTYSLFVEAVNNNEVGSGFLALGSTSALAAAPGSAPAASAYVAVLAMIGAWPAT